MKSLAIAVALIITTLTGYAIYNLCDTQAELNKMRAEYYKVLIYEANRGVR